jgi:hypothetical protein
MERELLSFPLPKKKPDRLLRRTGFFENRNYFEDCTGAGAGAGALGQQEAARKDAAAAMMRNLTVFIVVFSVGWLCSRDITSRMTAHS